MRREAELAAGHGEVRLSGFVTVSGRDRDELRRALRRGPRARRAGAPRAAPDVRPAGGGVHVHAAALPGPAMSRLRRAERPGHRCDHPPRPGDLPVRRRRRPRRPRRVRRPRLGRRRVLLSTRGRCTATGVLDDPNVIVLGKLGQGKSALVKTLLWRMLLFGRRAFVLDVKREYGPLCDAVGVNRSRSSPGRRAAQPARLAARGARAARAAARGDRDRARRRRSPRSRRPRCARRCARSARAAPASRRCRRSRRVLFAPVAEMAERLQHDARAAGRRRAPRRARAPGPLRGPAAGHVRRPDDARARPRREAARARPPRRPGLAGGRDPDGLRDRLDQRAAGADGRAARAASG